MLYEIIEDMRKGGSLQSIFYKMIRPDHRLNLMIDQYVGIP